VPKIFTDILTACINSSDTAVVTSCCGIIANLFYHFPEANHLRTLYESNIVKLSLKYPMDEIQHVAACAIVAANHKLTTTYEFIQTPLKLKWENTHFLTSLLESQDNTTQEWANNCLSMLALQSGGTVCYT
jgi:hypothetical protein